MARKLLHKSEDDFMPYYKNTNGKLEISASVMRVKLLSENLTFHFYFGPASSPQQYLRFRKNFNLNKGVRLLTVLSAVG